MEPRSENSTEAVPGSEVLVLAGDSTVAEALPDRDEAGWGWALRQMAAPSLRIHNLAKGGCSSKSYRAEGRWAKVLDLHPNWVLIQFGHNDQQGKGPARGTDPATDFRSNLLEFVADARGAGAKPVLVTSICRRAFVDGKFTADVLTEYAEATRAVAVQAEVPCLDLHAHSFQVFTQMGPEAAATFSPSDAPHDVTHFSRDSSKVIARWVLRLMQENVPKLARHFP